MKRNKALITVLSVALLAFSFAGCKSSSSKKADHPDTASVAENFIENIEKDLGLTDEDYMEIDPSQFSEGACYDGTFVTAVYKDCHMSCSVFDDEGKAKSRFELEYNEFKNYIKNNFVGEYKECFEDDYGYLVIDCTDPVGSGFAGRFLSFDEVYIGLYYDGNTYMTFYPNENSDGVKEAIEALGLPLADGTNT